MARRFSHRLFLLFLLFLSSAQQSHGLETLSPKSSLSPEQNETVLLSPDGTFSAGFYSVGENAYAFAIWYSRTPKPQTVVWMANRDNSVNGKKLFLLLQKNGDLILNDAGGRIAWRSETNGQPVNELALLNIGNIVLRGRNEKIFWQSFDSPTDTLLPGQPITKSAPLVSRMGSSSFKSGYFSFLFNENNYLVLVYQGSNITATYWPSTTAEPLTTLPGSPFSTTPAASPPAISSPSTPPTTANRGLSEDSPWTSTESEIVQSGGCPEVVVTWIAMAEWDGDSALS